MKQNDEAFDEIVGHVDSTTGVPSLLINTLDDVDLFSWLYAYYRQACDGDYSETEFKRYQANQHPSRFSWLLGGSRAHKDSNNDNLSLQERIISNNGRLRYKELQGTSQYYAKIQYMKTILNNEACLNVLSGDEMWRDWIARNRERLASIEHEVFTQPVVIPEHIVKKRQVLPQVDTSVVSPVIISNNLDNMAPLRFLSEQDQSELLKQDEQIVKMSDISKQSDELQSFITQEIKYLKYSLRESMRRVTELEHFTLSNASENKITQQMIDEHVQKLLSSCQGEKDVEEVTRVLNQVNAAYEMLGTKMNETNSILHQELRKRGAVEEPHVPYHSNPTHFNYWNIMGSLGAIAAAILIMKYKR